MLMYQKIGIHKYLRHSSGEISTIVVTIILLIGGLGVIFAPQLIKNSVSTQPRAQNQPTSTPSEWDYDTVNEFRDEEGAVLPIVTGFSWHSEFLDENGNPFEEASGNFPQAAGTSPTPTKLQVIFRPRPLAGRHRDKIARIQNTIPNDYEFISGFCEGSCDGVTQPLPTPGTKTATTFGVKLIKGGNIIYGWKVRKVITPTPTPDFVNTCIIDPSNPQTLHFSVNINPGLLPRVRFLLAQAYPALVNNSGAPYIAPNSDPVAITFNENGDQRRGRFLSSKDLSTLLRKPDNTGYHDRIALVFKKSLFPNSFFPTPTDSSPLNPQPLSKYKAINTFLNCDVTIGGNQKVASVVENSGELICFMKIPFSCQPRIDLDLKMDSKSCNESCQSTDPIPTGSSRICINVASPTPCPTGQSCTSTTPVEDKRWRNPRCQSDLECLCDSDSPTPTPSSSVTQILTITVTPSRTPNFTLVPSKSITLTPTRANLSPTPSRIPPSITRIPSTPPSITRAPTLSPRPTNTRYPTNTPYPSFTPKPPTRIPTRTVSNTPSPYPSSRPSMTLAPSITSISRITTSITPTKTPTPNQTITSSPSRNPSRPPLTVAVPSGSKLTPFSTLQPTILIPTPQSPDNIFVINNSSSSTLEKISLEACSSQTSCQKSEMNKKVLDSANLSLGNVFNLKDNQSYLMRCFVNLANGKTNNCKPTTLIAKVSDPQKISLNIALNESNFKFDSLKSLVDLDKNKTVNTRDFGLFIGDYGREGKDLLSDFNSDGKIDALDISILIQFLGENFSNITPSPTSIFLPTKALLTLTITPTPTPVKKL